MSHRSAWNESTGKRDSFREWIDWEWDFWLEAEFAHTVATITPEIRNVGLTIEHTLWGGYNCVAHSLPNEFIKKPYYLRIMLPVNCTLRTKSKEEEWQKRQTMYDSQRETRSLIPQSKLRAVSAFPDLRKKARIKYFPRY